LVFSNHVHYRVVYETHSSGFQPVYWGVLGLFIFIPSFTPMVLKKSCLALLSFSLITHETIFITNTNSITNKVLRTRWYDALNSLGKLNVSHHWVFKTSM
ncbi:hypothetical protein L9F63_004587, partial [Diploptera punctata]